LGVSPGGLAGYALGIGLTDRECVLAVGVDEPLGDLRADPLAALHQVGPDGGRVLGVRGLVVAEDERVPEARMVLHPAVELVLHPDLGREHVPLDGDPAVKLPDEEVRLVEPDRVEDAGQRCR